MVLIRRSVVVIVLTAAVLALLAVQVTSLSGFPRIFILMIQRQVNVSIADRTHFLKQGLWTGGMLDLDYPLGSIEFGGDPAVLGFRHVPPPANSTNSTSSSASKV